MTTNLEVSPDMKSLEELKFDEEKRKALRSEELRVAELRLKRLEVHLNRRGKWRELLSPLGVAAMAGLLGIGGSLGTATLNRQQEAQRIAATQALEAKRQEGSERIERQRQESSLILKIAEQPNPKQRAINLLFFAEAGFLTLDQAYRKYLRTVAGLAEGEAIPSPSLDAVVAIPKPSSPDARVASTETLTGLLGVPGKVGSTCTEPTSPRLVKLLATESVGPFRVNALVPMIEALRNALADVKQRDPELYESLGSAGALCVRTTRGSSTVFSRHAWGLAVDITIHGQLPQLQRGTTWEGLARLAPYLEKEGFILTQEEGFHFEITEQTILRWQREGKLGTN